MPNIHRLPEHLINQIAAGEVIERPASAVKELLENSLDAAAQKITLEVQEGGDTVLRITDDGHGMDKDDAILAFERHATSKISSTDDLFDIHTLGFRGEALASIAAVSKVNLQTKKKDSLEGTSIENHGGKLMNIKPVGVPQGTQIEIKDLFYNIPARKKYLKNVATEYGHILSTVTGIALAFHEVAFRFVHDGKVIFDLPKAPDSFTRIQSLLGRNIADELIPVFYGHGAMQLHGFIGKPLLARSSRNSQYFFVNRREVKSPVLSYAVRQSFHTLIPKDRHPVFLLYFTLDPTLVDVNVHPRKQEVRFAQEKEIFKIVLQASQKALEKYVLSPQFITKATQIYQEGRKHQHGLQLEDKPISINDAIRFTENFTRGIHETFQTVTKQAEKIENPQDIRFEDTQTGSEEKSQKPLPLNEGQFQPYSGEYLPKPEEIDQKNRFITREKTEVIMPLTQIDNSYLLCQQGENLVIIDQHAAHERIRYTEILEKFEAQKKTVQPLLLPCQFELSYEEVETLKSNEELLKTLGFEIESFGGNTFTLYTVPDFVAKEDLQQVILGLLDDLQLNTKKGDFQARKERALTYMACRSAVKFGDPLSRQEQDSLVQKLQTLALPYTCPHGRPTMITMSFEELERKFGRR